MHRPKVLLGWELGGGLGHVRPLQRVADALAARGREPVLVVKDLVEPRDLLRGTPHSVLPSPIGPKRADGGAFLARSYADILAIQGYDDAEILSALVRGWDGLLDVVRPDLVIVDHAPTLALAAYETVPVVAIGISFAVPPGHLPRFPPLLRDRPPAADEAALLGVVREVQSRRGRPSPTTLPGLFATARNCATVLPELDVYREARDVPAIGSLEPLPPPQPPVPPRFFAYLNAEATGWDAILATLAATGCPGRAFLRGSTGAQREAARRAGVAVVDRPIPTSELVAEAAVVVHHGCSGLSHAALAAGRPQLLFPAHLEHLLNARRLGELGVGLFLGGTFSTDLIAEGLRQLLHEPGFADGARAIAHDLAGRGPLDALPVVVERCLQAMAEFRPDEEKS